MDLVGFRGKIVAQNDLLTEEKNLTLTYTNIIFDKLAEKKRKYLDLIKSGSGSGNNESKIQDIREYLNELNKLEQQWLKINEILCGLTTDCFIDSLDVLKKPAKKKDVKSTPKKSTPAILPELMMPKFNPNQWYLGGVVNSIQNEKAGTFYMMLNRSELHDLLQHLNKVTKKQKKCPEIGEILGVKLDDQIFRAMRIPNPENQMKILLLDSAEDFTCNFKDEEFYQLPDHLKTEPVNIIYCKTDQKDILSKGLDVRLKFQLIAVENVSDRDLYPLHLVKIRSETKSMETVSTSSSSKNGSVNLWPTDCYSEGSWEELADQDIDVMEHILNSQQKKNELPKIASEITVKSSSTNPFINPEMLKAIEMETKREYAISREKMTAEEREMFDEEPQSFDDPLKAVLGYHPNDERKFCRYYDPTTGGCFKGGLCTLHHLPDLKDGATRDQEVCHLPLEPILLPEDSIVSVRISIVESPDVFYAQIQGQSEFTLKQLMDHLNLPNELKVMQPFAIDPSFGEIVFAPYLDGKFYRARFLHKIDQTCKVQFVDYGDHETVRLKDLRKYDKKFNYLPFQAVRFRFANVMPDGLNNEEAIKTFSDICHNRSFKAKIVKVDHAAGTFVNLYDDQGYDVGATLLRLGIVKPRNGSMQVSVDITRAG